MIDLHCHVLPGIDDGPATLEESVAIARTAAVWGTRLIVATPHVNPRFHNDAATIAGLVDELNVRLRSEGVPLEIRGGAEVALTRVGELADAELSRLGLGGGPWLLVEPPFVKQFARLGPIVLDLQRRGHGIVLAHPERCPIFHREPRLLETLVDAGVVTSITAGSLTGVFGREVRRFAEEMLRAEMVHNVASDAHDHAHRPPSIAAELEQAGLTRLADWLTETVPSAILAGSDIPDPPPDAQIDTPAGGRWWQRGR